jgi:hypothetical protein
MPASSRRHKVNTLVVGRDVEFHFGGLLSELAELRNQDVLHCEPAAQKPQSSGRSDLQPGQISQGALNVARAGFRCAMNSQAWRTFLRNHIGQIVAADFFVVPTATCHLLFVLGLFAHDRRRIRHVAVTAHPTAAWAAQQLREAVPSEEAPRYLLHDRDHAFDGVGTTAHAMGIEEVLTAPRSPWQMPSSSGSLDLSVASASIT